MQTTKDLPIDWDESLGKVERAIIVLEFRQESTPRISTKELETMLDQFRSFRPSNQGYMHLMHSGCS